MWSQPDPFAIVLCTYNGERFLDEQLASLRVQAGVAEVVISDDGSTDRTLQILQRHAAEDPRIRVSRNETQLGITANFQRAISLAKSPWIALSDQDDVWLPGKLARLRAAWDGESGLMHHASYKFRGAAPVWQPRLHAGDWRKFRGRDWRRLLFRNTVVGHSAVFRTEIARRLMPFPSDVPHDWWLGWGAAIQGPIQFVDEYLVLYRIHAQNAYHAAGSRYQRLRAEQELRKALLAAVIARSELPVHGREFAERYAKILRQSEASVMPLSLALFYLRHAPLFFGGVHRERSEAVYLRKSVLATLPSLFAPARPLRSIFAGERPVAAKLA